MVNTDCVQFLICVLLCELRCGKVMRSSTWCGRILACAFLLAAVLQMEKLFLPNRTMMKRWG